MTQEMFLQASGAGLEFAPGGSHAFIPVILFGLSGTGAIAPLAIPIGVLDTGSLATTA